MRLDLQNAIDLAIVQSSSVMYTQNRNVNYYWRYKNYLAMYRPVLELSGQFPNYKKTSTPVTQPDGSVQFKEVNNLLGSAQLSLSQPIPQLGTSVYAATTVSRAQDFRLNETSFSGSPFSIGFVQPLFAYNPMRWKKITEPMIYEEAQKEFIESIERIALNTTTRYFRYLRAQTDYKLAESNLANSENNLRIAESKRNLGKISENDFSRIKLSVYNAQKAKTKAHVDLKDADFELKSYIGLNQDRQIELTTPLNTVFFDIDSDIALREARENRKETPRYARQLIEAEEDLVQAKKASGMNISLRGSYGVSNSADTYVDIYSDPGQQRLLSLTVDVPILDWGRAESRIKLAQSKNDLVAYEVEKARMDFEREVVIQVEQFNLLKEWIAIAEEADKVAENGYRIALKKFQNGEISITDLNISLQERESAKRDYISSLQSYWVAYYNLRILTLYDFNRNEKIWYVNPMLSGEKG
jgi:outer membrane protein TolC